MFLPFFFYFFTILMYNLVGKHIGMLFKRSSIIIQSVYLNLIYSRAGLEVESAGTPLIHMLAACVPAGNLLLLFIYVLFF